MRFAFVAGLLLAATLTPSAMAQVYVVAAGNNVGRPSEGVLRYAEEDATELQRTMLEIGDAAPSDVRLLLGADANTLRATLHGLAATVTSRAGGGRLLLYYSGHAGASGLHMGDTTLPYSELEQLARAVPVATRVVIVDGCKSGGLSRVKGGVRVAAFDIGARAPVEAEGLAIITSSAAGENSHESDTLRSALFTHHLLNGLRGAADADSDRTVTLDEVYRYTRRETLRSSGSGGQLQRPTFRYDIKGRASVVLTRLARAANAARMRLPRAGLYVLLDGEDRRVVAELTMSKGGGELVVAPGDYIVQKRERRSYREVDIEARPGKLTRVRLSGSREIAYAELVRKGGGDRSVVHGLYLFGGGRGEILDGFGPVPQAVLGWEMDFRQLSLGLRGRFGFTAATGTGAVSDATHLDGGVALVAHRFFDWPAVSVGIGLLAEVTWLSQRFEGASGTSVRDSVGGAFGLLVTLERRLVGGLSLRLEGGPLAHLFERAVVRGGAAAETELATPVTWWVAGGLGVRF